MIYIYTYTQFFWYSMYILMINLHSLKLRAKRSLKIHKFTFCSTGNGSSSSHWFCRRSSVSFREGIFEKSNQQPGFAMNVPTSVFWGQQKFNWWISHPSVFCRGNIYSTPWTWQWDLPFKRQLVRIRPKTTSDNRIIWSSAESATPYSCDPQDKWQHNDWEDTQKKCSVQRWQNGMTPAIR